MPKTPQGRSPCTPPPIWRHVAQAIGPRRLSKSGYRGSGGGRDGGSGGGGGNGGGNGDGNGGGSGDGS
eukprot:11185013-Lingulodinium_polyedra.AAC.1